MSTFGLCLKYKTAAQYFISLSVIVFLQGCGRGDVLDCSSSEVVLQPGMEVSLHKETPKNDLRVVCNRAMKRKIFINGLSRTVSVENRPSRWFGSYGVSTPFSLFDLFRIGPHFFYEEGVQHFCNQEEAMMWLRQCGTYSEIFYNKEGLVLTIECKERGRDLSIGLWQLCINGGIPRDLSGAKGGIEVRGVIKCPDVNNFQPSSPVVVEGVYFTGRSCDLMKELYVSFDEVLQVIRLGKVEVFSEEKKVYEYGPVDEWGHMSAFTSIRVFTDGEGRVDFIRAPNEKRRGEKGVIVPR